MIFGNEAYTSFNVVEGFKLGYMVVLVECLPEKHRLFCKQENAVEKFRVES